MTDIAKIASKIAVSHEGATVLIELICNDEYGAAVLYDDVSARLNSDEGLRLFVKIAPEAQGAGA